jgi:hypothetical protein
LGVGDVPSFQPKVQVIAKTWEPDIGLVVTRDEVQEVRRLLQDYVRYFAFSLKELGQLQGHEGSNCIGG